MPALPDMQWEDLEKRFQNGESLHSLARRYHISRSTVRAHLIRIGYDTSKRKTLSTEVDYALWPIPFKLLEESFLKHCSNGDFDLVEKILKCKLPRKFKWKLRGKLEAEKKQVGSSKSQEVSAQQAGI